MLREKLNELTEPLANTRFREALPFLKVTSGTRNPEVRKFLDFAPAADVRNDVIDVPSALSVSVERPALTTDVAAPLRSSPDRFDFRPRKALLTRIDHDGSRKPVVVRLTRRVSTGVQSDNRRQFAVVVVLQGISTRVPLKANVETIPPPGD